MPKLSVWTIPITPYSPVPWYIRRVAGGPNEATCYTKYIVDVFGIIDRRSNTVREWQMPPPPGTPVVNGSMAPGNLYGLAITKTGLMWAAWQDVSMLVEFSPHPNLGATGVATWFSTTSTAGIASPYRVRLDDQDRPWFAGHYGGVSTSTWSGIGGGPLVGFLDKATRTVTSWHFSGPPILPTFGLWFNLVSASDLFVEQGGNVVWLALMQTQVQLLPKGIALARIDTTTNKVDVWFRPLPIQGSAGFAGAYNLCADAPVNPASVFFSYNDPVNGNMLMRLDTATGDIFGYPRMGPHLPAGLCMGPSGHRIVYADNVGSRITVPIVQSSCEQSMPFAKLSWQSQKSTTQYSSREILLHANVFTVAPAVSNPPVVRDPCYVDYALSPPFYPNDIAHDPAKPGIFHIVEEYGNRVATLET